MRVRGHDVHRASARTIRLHVRIKLFCKRYAVAVAAIVQPQQNGGGSYWGRPQLRLSRRVHLRHVAHRAPTAPHACAEREIIMRPRPTDARSTCSTLHTQTSARSCTENMVQRECMGRPSWADDRLQCLCVTRSLWSHCARPERRPRSLVSPRCYARRMVTRSERTHVRIQSTRAERNDEQIVARCTPCNVCCAIRA